MSIWTTLKWLLTGQDDAAPLAGRVEPQADSLAADPAGGAPASGAHPGDPPWQEVYASRQAWYEREIGSFPGDLLKVRSLSGIWPGGGLFALPADRIAPGAWLYTTFGLTNRDMPAPAVAAAAQAGAADAAPSFGPAPAQAEAPEPAEGPEPTRGTAPAAGSVPGPGPGGPVFAPAAGAAGYGHELVLLTNAPEQWPLWVLQWAATAELLDGTGLLRRVEEHGALTVQDIDIDEGRRVNLLIAKARPPLPSGVDLPNGRLDLLVATVITDAELQWSLQNGRLALLERLAEAGIGQFSELRRADVI